MRHVSIQVAFFVVYCGTIIRHVSTRVAYIVVCPIFYYTAQDSHVKFRSDGRCRSVLASSLPNDSNGVYLDLNNLSSRAEIDPGIFS